MTSPVSSAARASGTMTNQPVNSIAIQAGRTACASRLVAAEAATATYATTGQPCVPPLRRVLDGSSVSRQYVEDKPWCRGSVVTYTGMVPKLWNETIEAHRRAVRDATLDTTAALVAEHGLASVTMSQIAAA